MHFYIWGEGEKGNAGKKRQRRAWGEGELPDVAGTKVDAYAGVCTPGTVP